MTAERRYPDSAGGALEALAAMSGMDVASATARPDPAVDGVWEVAAEDGRRSIVYLAGYVDPFGRVRQYNDFETEDPR